MAKVTSLPLELFIEILKDANIHDKLRLSTTCSHLRHLLAPILFQTVRFTNNERIAQSALSTVKKYGIHTTRLEFTGYSRLSKDYSAPALPSDAIQLLKGSPYTPNLRTVQVRFTLNSVGTDIPLSDPDSLLVFKAFQESETEESVAGEEREKAWRSLMNEAWMAISANTLVKGLVVLDFMPKWTSAFRSHQFRCFLAGLESASIQVFGTQHGGIWPTIMSTGYRGFLEKFDAILFQHMVHLKHLHLSASKYGPLGLEGRLHIPLLLSAKAMPALESLKLEWCFIGNELLAFLREHAQTLKSLELQHCFSGTDDIHVNRPMNSATAPMSWATFFDELATIEPALVKFVLDSTGYTPSIMMHPDDEVPEWLHEPVDFQEIIQQLNNNPQLKFFGHAYLHEYFGRLVMNREESVEQFRQGEDQRSFDRLISLIEDNAAPKRFN
jgi:hypothetical protein